MKEKVKSNLESLLSENLKQLKGSTLQDLFDELIHNNPKAFNLNKGVIDNFFDSEEIQSFEKAKKNQELISCFDRALGIPDATAEIVAEITSDMLSSLKEIKYHIEENRKQFSCQIIFLEYDYEPIAQLSGFSKGDYPILSKPQYFEYDYKEELFNGIGRVDYSRIWHHFIVFNEMIEELGLIDGVWESKRYQALLNSYKYKTHLILFEVFDRLGKEIFNGIPIQKPLYIYGNEHDCEAMNIYVFE